MWYHSVKSHYDLMFYITLQTSTAAYFTNMCLYLFQISPAPYLLIWKHHLSGPPGSHVLKNLHDNYSMVMVQHLFINFLYNNLSINGTILFYFYRWLLFWCDLVLMTQKYKLFPMKVVYIDIYMVFLLNCMQFALLCKL